MSPVFGVDLLRVVDGEEGQGADDRVVCRVSLGRGVGHKLAEVGLHDVVNGVQLALLQQP